MNTVLETGGHGYEICDKALMTLEGQVRDTLAEILDQMTYVDNEGIYDLLHLPREDFVKLSPLVQGEILYMQQFVDRAVGDNERGLIAHFWAYELYKSMKRLFGNYGDNETLYLRELWKSYSAAKAAYEAKNPR